MRLTCILGVSRGQEERSLGKSFKVKVNPPPPFVAQSTFPGCMDVVRGVVKIGVRVCLFCSPISLEGYRGQNHKNLTFFALSTAAWALMIH